MFLGQIPDPLIAIADNHFLFCATPATFPGFDIEALAELPGAFDGAGVGGGIRIANGVAFLVPLGLREYATQLSFTPMSGQAVEFALASRCFLLYYGHTSAVHLHIQGWVQAHRG